MNNGIIRPVDKMGRVVIPKEYRNDLKVENEKDSFVITRENDAIILRKFEPTCVFCHRIGPCVEYGGYTVCKRCIERLEASKKDIK